MVDEGKGRGGVYDFAWGLITEGKHAHFVNQEGRFIINWVIAVEQYFERHLSQQKTKEFNRRDAGNKLRGALLNYHAKDGAMEYMDVRRLNERNEIVERQFQMPRRILTTLQEKSEGNKEKESSSDDSNFEVIFHENRKCLHHDTFCCCIVQDGQTLLMLGIE